MGVAEAQEKDDRIPEMQAGLRGWVARTARRGGRGLRDIPPPVLLSLLCAAALSPVIAVGVGVTGAAAVAGVGVLSSVGGGALSGVVASAWDRLVKGGKQRPAQDELEAEIARQIQAALQDGTVGTEALRGEIGRVLERIDAGGTLLRAVVDEHDAELRADMIAAVGLLSSDMAGMQFLLEDLARATAEIQESVDEQNRLARAGAEVLGSLAADVRLILQQVASLRRQAETKRTAAEAETPRWTDGCPYRGLEYFRESDEAVFYGRRHLTARLVVAVTERLDSGGTLVLTGASGAGKSSLLRAGLVPALASGELAPGSERWPRLVMTPGSEPLTELAIRLGWLTGVPGTALLSDLAERPDEAAPMAVRQAVLAASEAHADQPAASLQLAASRGDDERLVLIVDQFEDVFTAQPGSKGESQRSAFIAALIAAARPAAGQPPAIVVVAVRGDYWDQCAAHPELAAALTKGLVVGPMAEADLRLAVVGPAEAAGLRIESGLIDTVMADLTAASRGDAVGALPLLSQAMMRTWENREGTQLTVRGYERTGGVARAVEVSADGVYNSLPPGEQILARQALVGMTIVSRDGRITRRPVSRAELYAGNAPSDRAKLDAIIEAFAARRLVVLDNEAVQLAHDALLTAWPRLRGWLDEDQETMILRSRLADDASEWRDSGTDSSFLYRGAQLAVTRQAVSQWSASPGRYPAMDSTEQEFLAAGETAARLSRNVRRLVGACLAFLLVAALAGAGLAAAAAGNARQQTRDELSLQLAAESEQVLSSDPATAAGLAAAAWAVAPTSAARTSLLQVLAQPERAVLQAGSEPLYALAFSPNGRLLATADADGTLELWGTATHRRVGAPMATAITSRIDGHVVHGQPGLLAVAFSPDGRLLATVGTDGMARLWSVMSGRQIGRSMPVSRRTTGPLRFGGVAFSPKGNLLATADGAGPARLWYASSQRPAGAPLACQAGAKDAASTGRVNKVAFSPSGKLLAIACDGGAVRLFDEATQRPAGPPMITGASDTIVSGLAFSPSGAVLAVAGGDGSAQLWDVAAARRIGAQISGGVAAVAFSPDDADLAVATGIGAQVWAVATHSQLAAFPPGGQPSVESAVAFSPEGTLLATGGDDGVARLWDLSVDRQAGAPISSGGDDAAFSPDGRALALAGSSGAQLWDLATHRLTATLGRGLMDAVAFSPDGKILATASATGLAQLWNVATGQAIGAAMRLGSGDSQEAVAFSPNGRLLATAGWDGPELWDVASDRLLARVPTTYASAIAFSPDGNTVAYVSNLSAWLWHVHTGRISGPVGGRLTGAIAFSPRGNTLATLQNTTATLWDTATGSQIGAPLAVPGGEDLYDLAFSPDGLVLAIIGYDGTTLWSAVSQHELTAAPIATGNYYGTVAYSPGGQILVTTSPGDPTLFWDIGFPRNLQLAACSIPGGPLSRQQWQTYAPGQPYQAYCP